MNEFDYHPTEFLSLATLILDNGRQVKDQRGLATIELINAHLRIPEPRYRIIFDPERKMNLPFAFAEFLSMLVGDNHLSTFQQFIKSYDRFSSDGITIDGSYAGRVMGFTNPNQIDLVIEMLKKEPSTRRAVIQLYDWHDLTGMGKKNTPCTLTIQFLIRNGRLDMIVNMRSNDLFLGFTYDMFNFSMLQEYIAVKTHSVLGTYYHNAGSLHIYEKDLAFIQTMTKDAISLPMNLMDYEAAKEMILVAREYYNLGAGLYAPRIFTSSYSNDIVLSALAFKNRDNADYFNLFWKNISDMAIQLSMSNWSPEITK